MPLDLDTQLESFARAAARFADAFCDRQATLSALQLDEAQWRALQQRWLGRIQQATSAGDPSLLSTYQSAYEAERKRLVDQRHSEPVARIPGTPRLPDVDATGEAHPVLMPALPFRTGEPTVSHCASRGEGEEEHGGANQQEQDAAVREESAARTEAEAEDIDEVDRTSAVEDPLDLDALPFGDTKE